jgi:hypothetical protein
MIDFGSVYNQYPFLGYWVPICFQNVVFFVHLGTFTSKNKLICTEALWIQFFRPDFVGVKINNYIVYFSNDFVLISIMWTNFFLFINIQAFIVFIKIHFGYTSFEIKWLFRCWLWRYLLSFRFYCCVFGKSLSEMPCKSFSFLLLKIINHVF